tara:strand:+ start:776 stop:1144 length:369 start_codon:yes stop_codon:yes gene_type:complete
MKVIAFDLDGVLCDRPKDIEHLLERKYDYCFPIVKNVKLVNKLYDEGYYIKIYTARGMSTFSNNRSLLYEKLFTKTKDFLEKNDIRHHELIMGKEHYDLLIDDKALNSENRNLELSIKEVLK